MTHEKKYGPTPSGGAWSEIYYMNDKGDPADADAATRCIIRECREDGTLINEIYGTCSSR